MNDASKEIYFLQNITTRSLFDQGLKLFVMKYMNFNTTVKFIEHFKDKFIDNISGWFESYDIFNPSTNNGLERFNLTIKDKYVNWKQYDIKNFIIKCIEILNDSGKTNLTILYTHKEINCKDTKIHECEIYMYFAVTNEINNLDIINFKENFFGNFEMFNNFRQFYKNLIFITVKKVCVRWTDIFCKAKK